jgi:hypothetical protein
MFGVSPHMSGNGNHREHSLGETLAAVIVLLAITVGFILTQYHPKL